METVSLHPQTKNMTLKSYLSDLGYLLAALLFLHLVNPFDMGHIFAYLLLIVYFLTKKDVLIQNLDFEFFLLLLFGFTYSLFNSFGDHKGVQFLIMQAVFPSFFYLLGKSMIHKEMSPKNVVAVVLISVFIFSSTAMLSVSSDLMKGGFTQIGRLINNYWNNKPLQSTYYSIYLIYNMAIPIIFIASRKTFNMGYRLGMLAIYIVSLLCVFRLGTRTAIAITIITTTLGLFLLFSQQSFKQNIRLVVILGVSVYLFLNFNPIGLDAEVFSTLGHRLQSANTSSTATAGGRTAYWAQALNSLVEHPLGWTSRKHAHNLWLDLAKVAGVIPLFFFLAFNIKNFKSLVRLVRLPKSDDMLLLKITLGLFTLGALVAFFTEPVLEGSLFVVTFYCFLQGMLKNSLYTDEVSQRIAEAKTY